MGVDGGRREAWNPSMAPAQGGMEEAASLEERFGIEGIGLSSPTETEILPTGIASLDQALDGGLSSGVLSEIVSGAPSSGGQSLLLRLLAGMRQRRRFAALVDGADRFDPQTVPPELLEGLLWVRCGSALEAMRAADVLLRDENLGMVALDLRGNEERDLRRLKSADWYRLQRLAERSGAFACVFASRAIAPSAQTRVELKGSLSLDFVEGSAAAIGGALAFEVSRQRRREREAFPNLIQRQAAG